MILNTFTYYWSMVCHPIGFKHRWGGLFWSNFLSAIIFNLWDTLPILCYHIGFILCKIEHWRVKSRAYTSSLLYHEINNQSRGGLRSNHGSKSTQPVPFKTNDSAFNETQCSLIFQEILHQKSLQKTQLNVCSMYFHLKSKPWMAESQSWESELRVRAESQSWESELPDRAASQSWESEQTAECESWESELRVRFVLWVFLICEQSNENQSVKIFFILRGKPSEAST